LADDEVEVIGHNAVADDVDGKTAEAAAKQVQKVLIVHHFRKQASAVIAAIRHVCWDANR
jgi:hypothetical protein